MSALFTPFRLRDVTLRNRIVVSPMCEYSSDDGFANDWHVVHLGSRAVGGAGLVLTEAIAVTAEGRISPFDLGIYRDEHVEQLARIARFCAGQGAAWGTQLAHAGRKASTKRPWDGTGAVEQGGWTPVAPTGAPFDPTYPVPRALDEAGIAAVIARLRGRRAPHAGGRRERRRAALRPRLSRPPVPQPAGQHADGPLGRLVREPHSARARDRRAPSAQSGRSGFPLFARVSATDWVEGGWDAEQTVELARLLKEDGVDLIDCSTGGAVPVGPGTIPVGPLYQTPFAEQVRREAEIPTGAVGMITEPAEAEAIVAQGRADLVVMARELLRDPYWPIFAARALGAEAPWPPQYQRAAGPRASMKVPVAQ